MRWAAAALSVGGTEMDLPRYLQSCSGEGADGGPDCGWFAAEGVELVQMREDRMAELVPYVRVSSVIALQPEYPLLLGGMAADVDTLLMSLGPTPDATVSGPGAKMVAVPEASGLCAFATCTDAGPKILLEEGGDTSLCGAPRDLREAVHQKVVGAIITFLAKTREWPASARQGRPRLGARGHPAHRGWDRSHDLSVQRSSSAAAA